MRKYAEAHSGRFPDSLEQLVLSGAKLDKRVFVCPSSNDDPTTATDREAIAASFSQPGHLSYTYLAKGLTNSVASNVPVITEPLSNHGDMVGILFADGHVDFCTKQSAKQILGDRLVDRR